MKDFSRVCAYIDLDAAVHNMNEMHALTAPHTKLMAVVKTDGYGHGALPIARELEGLDYVYGFAVATAEEGLALRADGRKKPVLILGTVFEEQHEEVLRADLCPTVFSYDTAGKDNVQKGIYRISHPLVDFYYTYMYPYWSELQTLSVGEFYNRYVMPDFRRHVTGYFKHICRQHLARLNDRKRLPIQLDVIGEWVGKDGELDIIAQDAEDHTLIGLCNWERPVTYEDYNNLLDCAKKAKISADYVYMYSAFRFDERLNLETKVRTNLKLIQISDF